MESETKQSRIRQIVSHVIQWCAIGAVVAISAKMIVVDRPESLRQAVIREQQQINEAIIAEYLYPTAVIVSDGTVVRWNNAIADLTGYSQDEINRVGIAALIASRDKQKHYDGMKKTFADPTMIGKKLVIRSTGLLKKDGTITSPVDVVARLFNTEAGHVFASVRIDKVKDTLIYGKKNDDEHRELKD